jgi:hypothetical protein
MVSSSLKTTKQTHRRKSDQALRKLSSWRQVRGWPALFATLGYMVGVTAFIGSIVLLVSKFR